MKIVGTDEKDLVSFETYRDGVVNAEEEVQGLDDSKLYKEIDLLSKISGRRRKRVKTKDVENFLKTVPIGAVIYELDKNTNRAYVECPFLLKRRIMNEVEENSAFEKVNSSPLDVIGKFEDIYKKHDLKKFGRWRNGRVPNSFVIPKHKSPLDKSRLISSYYNHCLKEVFQTASKILTWILKSQREKKTF